MREAVPAGNVIERTHDLRRMVARLRDATVNQMNCILLVCSISLLVPSCNIGYRLHNMSPFKEKLPMNF